MKEARSFAFDLSRTLWNDKHNRTLAMGGQADAERGARVPGSFGPGAQADGAAIFADDALGDPESEARALAGLGGEEWFEDTIADSVRNAGPVVGDGDTRSRGFVDAGDADVDLAAGGRHSVDGVDHEVGEDLAEFAGACEHTSVGLVAGEDVDGAHLQGGLLQLEDSVEKIGEVDDAGARGIAVEGKCL